MATKKITELQIRDLVSSTLSIPADDGIQTYRITAEQIKDFILATENVTRNAIAAAERVPRGAVMPFAGTIAPAGYLFCDGSAVSRATYADLFTAIGSAHGSGDGATTFNLPDYRGRFLRGVDGGIARDPNRATRTAMNTGGNIGDALGSVQGHATARPTTTFTGATTTTGNHHHVTTAGDGNPGSQYAAAIGSNQNQRNTLTDGPHNHNISITGGGDSETRPTNANVNYIIKF